MFIKVDAFFSVLNQHHTIDTVCRAQLNLEYPLYFPCPKYLIQQSSLCCIMCQLVQVERNDTLDVVSHPMFYSKLRVFLLFSGHSSIRLLGSAQLYHCYQSVLSHTHTFYTTLIYCIYGQFHINFSIPCLVEWCLNLHISLCLPSVKQYRRGIQSCDQSNPHDQ